MNIRIQRIITLFVLTIMAYAAMPAQAQSDLYITNFFGNKVTRHNGATGALLSTISVPRPTGAEIGPDGLLYTVGYDGAIRRFDPATGALLATLATNIATFPDDLHFGPDGNIYIACELGQGVLRFDRGGTPAPAPGKSGAVFFASQQRLTSSTFGPDGSLYVTDYGANAVFRINSTGAAFTTFTANHLNGPLDLHFGADGNLYVANRNTNDVTRFNGVTGLFIDVFASGNGLNKTDSFDFGPDGNLYVAGRNNNAVFLFSGTSGTFLETFISTNLDDPYRVRFSRTAASGAVSISNLTPSSAVVNSPDFPTTITGTGFSANSIVRFNNTQVAFISASANVINLKVPAALLTSQRTYNVTVTTYGKVSNAVAFRVTATNVNKPLPNLKIVGQVRTGVDPNTGDRYAVLVFGNLGLADITNINFSDVRFYYDDTHYFSPTSVSLEAGATPPGTLSNTPPETFLQVKFAFPFSAPLNRGTAVISVSGTSSQGNFNAGSRFLIFL
jgi:streptogramin lyase